MTKKSQLAAPEPAPPVKPERVNELAGIIKQSVLQTFERIGGVTGMVRWARKNPGAFYKLFAQLAPQLDRHGKGTGVVVQVAAFGKEKPTTVDLKAIDATPPEADTDDPPPE